MKKLTILAAALGLFGCMSTKPPTEAKKPVAPAAAAAEKKLAARLPAVTPESVTMQNWEAKAREMQAELERDARRLAAARGPEDLQK